MAEDADQERPAGHRQNTADRLSDCIENTRPDPEGRISLRQLDESLAERSFGAFLVIFSLPNLVPMPPGATLVLGLPLIFISWQMMTSARHSLWLPGKIANASVEGARFIALTARILPWLRAVEQAVRPRFWFMESRSAERLLGGFCLLLAIVVFIPIPLGNWLPALALGIIGLSLTERDGVGVIAGIAVGVVAIIIATVVVMAAGALLSLLL